MHHVSRWFFEPRLADVMSSLLPQYDTPYIRSKFFIGSTAPHLAVEVVVGMREEACAEGAVGGDSQAAAMAAEGAGDGSDDADLADAVGEGEPAGGLAGCARRQFAQAGGAPCVEAGDDLVHWDHGLGPPGAGVFGGGWFFQRHELDEADDDSLAAGELGEWLDLGVVESAQQDAVDLDRAEAGGLRGVDTGQNALEAARYAGDAREGLGIDGVHADGDAIESGAGERRGERFQQMAVGGEGDVERPAGFTRIETRAVGCIGGAHLRQFGDHLDQAGAQQGFAAGEAHLLDAERDQDAHHSQILGDGKLGIGCGFVAGAAVDALVVAAVCDGDAEVGDGPPEGVAQAQAGGLLGCV